MARRRRQSASPATWGLLLVCVICVGELVRPAVAGRDYYDVLGLTRSATMSEIKRAFRKKSVELHPDKNKDDKDAQAKFMELSNAYEVLSDEEKRRQYNQFGEEGVRNGGGGQGGDWDPFESFFGGGFGGGRRRQPQERRGPDMVVPLYVSLEAVYNGAVIDVSHRRQVQCSNWKDCETKCSKCRGSGRVVETIHGMGMIQQIQRDCPVCGGSGKSAKKKCSACPEGQFEMEEKQFLVDVEKGVPDGHMIQFEEHADEVADALPGHLYFQIKTASHDRYNREGHTLFHRMTVSLGEALLGINRTLHQLDGRDIRVETTGITKPLDKIRIPQEGMPVMHREGKTGDMVVEIWVDFPKTLDEVQRQSIAGALLDDAACAEEL